MVDAGHFSFADICGIDTAFTAGCGHARGQTDPSTELNYLDNEGARGLAASYAAASFRGELTGDAAGLPSSRADTRRKSRYRARGRSYLVTAKSDVAWPPCEFQ
jgi:hypothetical protein